MDSMMESMYEEPTIIATFDAADLLGDAHGFPGNGSNIVDHSEMLWLWGPTRPM